MPQAATAMDLALPGVLDLTLVVLARHAPAEHHRSIRVAVADLYAHDNQEPGASLTTCPLR
jgi:hypothetical protein